LKKEINYHDIIFEGNLIDEQVLQRKIIELQVFEGTQKRVEGQGLVAILVNTIMNDFETSRFRC
jgi:hypothetical protein